MEEKSTTMYCMKCKKKQPYNEYIEGINKKGMRMHKATCPECKGNMFKIAGKAK